MPYSVRKDLTPENILRLISEEDVFRHYIGQDFVLGSSSSPLRKGDDSPSFSIFASNRSKYNLRFKDHATGKSGSCFDFVMMKYCLTYGEALAVINNDFNLGLDVQTSKYAKSVQAGFTYKEIEYPIIKTNIEVISRPFLTSDIRYWKQFNIEERVLVYYNVIAVKYYWLIKGELKRLIKGSSESPIYAYCFPNDEYKMYAPMRTDGYKWISNTRRLTIQGLGQVFPHSVRENTSSEVKYPKSHVTRTLSLTSRLLIITKSLKDVMSLYSFGIPAIAPMSESVVLNTKQIANLREHYGAIFSLMDFDRTGIHNANQLRHRYGIEAMFLTNGKFKSKNYGSKDFSDYVRDNGTEKALLLLRSLGLKI